MRVQGSPLTPLQFAALAMYEEGPRHPYEVYQEMLRRREDALVKVRPGTLYHAINRLERAGLIVEHETGREGNRPERTTYVITEAGIDAAADALRGMLARPAEEYPEFPLAVAELTILAPDEAADLLSRRVTHLRGRLAELDAAGARVREMDLHESLWLEATWLQAMTQTDLDWTERTMTRIRCGDLSWERRR